MSSSSRRRVKEVVVSHDLRTAIMVDGELCDRLDFRRPTFGDLEAMDGATGDVGQLLALVARLADIRISEARMIDARDVTALGPIVAELLGGSEIPLEPGE